MHEQVRCLLEQHVHSFTEFIDNRLTQLIPEHVSHIEGTFRKKMDHILNRKLASVIDELTQFLNIKMAIGLKRMGVAPEVVEAMQANDDDIR